MATREQFHNELEDLKKRIIALAKVSGDALSDSINALFSQDIELAQEVIKKDAQIDRGEIEMNDELVLLIAKQQPVATDLRRIIIYFRILTDIERMADNAKNIANSTIELGIDNKIPIPDGIKKAHEIVQYMLEKSISALEKEDVDIAKELGKIDDEVDSLYNDVISELLGRTATNPDKIQYIMQVAFCARYLERFADHITNIGESILYLVRGINYDLN